MSLEVVKKKEISIAFRCDFGLDQGYGHLMRVLSLSYVFNNFDRIKTYILTRSIITKIEKLFSNAGVRVIKLPQKAAGLSFNPGDYLRISDSFITIFDNYDVSIDQMKKYKKNYPNLVAIDDLGDRIFDVDIIVNQNFQSDQIEYRTINKTKLFLGSKYALLRNNILKAKRRKKQNHIFISFGGGEVYDRIKGFLKLLLSIDKSLDEPITFDFVISGNSKNKGLIKFFFKKCEKLKLNFIENEMNLSSYMSRAEFAITAAGSTVYELAYLGIPQIVFVIDKNQEITGNMINEMGLGQCLGNIKNLENVNFNETFFSFLHDDFLKDSISKQAQSLIDGKGAKRVVEGILNHYGYS